MSILLILALALGIIVILLSLKVITKIFRAFFGIVAVVFFLFLVVALIAYSDAKSINDALENGERLFLYEDGVVLAGMRMINDTITPLNASELVQQNISGDRFIITYTKEGLMDGLPDNIRLGDKTYEKEMFAEIMASDDPLTLLSEQGSTDTTPKLTLSVSGLKEDDKVEVKGLFFAMAVTQSLQHSGTAHLLISLKKGTIIMVPTLTTVRLMKLVPDGIYTDVLGTAMEKLIPGGVMS